VEGLLFKVRMTLIFLLFILKYKLNKEPWKKCFSNLTCLCIFFRALKFIFWKKWPSDKGDWVCDVKGGTRDLITASVYKGFYSSLRYVSQIFLDNSKFVTVVLNQRNVHHQTTLNSILFPVIWSIYTNILNQKIPLKRIDRLWTRFFSFCICTVL
jgi:hypothetical protein